MSNKKNGILYIGNKLTSHGFTQTGVETLGVRLKQFTNVYTVSNKKNKLFRLFDMIFSIIKNKNRIDFVLIDTYSGWAFSYAILCSLFAQLFNIKYIPILRGGNLPERIRSSFLMSNLVFKHSYINIAPSQYLEKEFNDFNYKVKYIPNYIDLDNYKHKIRTNCGPKLIWVRSFHTIYNSEMAVRVLHMLLQSYPEAKLCMIGPDKDGSMQSCKELAEKLSLKKHITFTGLLSKKEWIELSSNYDIFINTTYIDNMPVSVIEAMALGFPIVSTNVGGLKYLHNDGQDALLVDKNDARGMKENINALLNDSALAKSLSMNARKKAEEYSWENVDPMWRNIIFSS